MADSDSRVRELVAESPPAATESAPSAKDEKEALRIGADEERLKGIQQDRTERKKYAGRIFVLVSSWLGAILGILLLQGLLGSHGCFDLSDSVLMTLLGGTTGSVIAVVVLVVKYLFPKR